MEGRAARVGQRVGAEPERTTTPRRRDRIISNPAAIPHLSAPLSSSLQPPDSAPVPGHPRYRVTPDGRIWYRRKRRKSELTGKGTYLLKTRGNLSDDWHAATARMPEQWPITTVEGRVRTVSHLVLAAFGQPRPSTRHYAQHRDGDPRNCAIDNLYWTTRRAPRRPNASPISPHRQPRTYIDLSHARPRRCLGCNRTFDSLGPGNRFCARCTRINTETASVRDEPKRLMIDY